MSFFGKWLPWLFGQSNSRSARSGQFMDPEEARRQGYWTSRYQPAEEPTQSALIFAVPDSGQAIREAARNALAWEDIDDDEDMKRRIAFGPSFVAGKTCAALHAG